MVEESDGQLKVGTGNGTPTTLPGLIRVDKTLPYVGWDLMKKKKEFPSHPEFVDTSTVKSNVKESGVFLFNTPPLLEKI